MSFISEVRGWGESILPSLVTLCLFHWGLLAGINRNPSPLLSLLGDSVHPPPPPPHPTSPPLQPRPPLVRAHSDKFPFFLSAAVTPYAGALGQTPGVRASLSADKSSAGAGARCRAPLSDCTVCVNAKPTPWCFRGPRSLLRRQLLPAHVTSSAF